MARKSIIKKISYYMLFIKIFCVCIILYIRIHIQRLMNIAKLRLLQFAKTNSYTILAM